MTGDWRVALSQINFKYAGTCANIQMDRTRKFSLRPAWPEKVAIAAAIFVFAMSLLLWIFLAIGAKSVLNARFAFYALNWCLTIEGIVVLPFWFGLRVMHLAMAAISQAFCYLDILQKNLSESGEQKAVPQLFHLRRGPSLIPLVDPWIVRAAGFISLDREKKARMYFRRELR